MAPFNSQLDEVVKNYDSLRTMLHNSFCRKGLGLRAEDLTSEVMYRLLKRICDEKFLPIENIQAFAFEIARHLIADTYKTLPKQPQSLEDIKSKYLLQENSLDDKLDKEKYLYYMHKCADELNLSLNDRRIVFRSNSDKDEDLSKEIGLTVNNIRRRRNPIIRKIGECAKKHLKLKK